MNRHGGTRDYKYTQEISQMMFVFGEVQDPLPETVNLVEDIVRSQIIELILQARALAIKRGARYASAEDLMFLIRHDRGKVNRLRTYLSWKDVRKHAKDTGGDGGGNLEVEPLEDDGAAGDKLAAKAQKITIKLPWDIITIFTEVLKNSGVEEDEEEDEDDIEAHEDANLRLKEADDVTRQMTREEYQHYSDCRQASFTYRKAKRFREFLALPPSVDLRANDDTVDIVGFLAFETVRALTVRALAVKRALEETSVNAGAGVAEPPSKRRRTDGASELSSTLDVDYAPPSCSLFARPPETRSALRAEHIQDAFVRMQDSWFHQRAAGIRNWRGGLVRTGVSLI